MTLRYQELRRLHYEGELDSGTIYRCVVPIENTSEGTINLTIDRLAQSEDLFVQGEVILSITQCLLGLPGAKLSDVHEVWSIPPAIAQCRKFIKKHGTSIKNFDSTSSQERRFPFVPNKWVVCLRQGTLLKL